MKRHLFYYSFLFFLCFQAAAQVPDSSVFRVSQIPVTGLILDNGWTFKAGDDLSRAKNDYDDSGWTPVNPADDLHHMPEVKKAGMGWFRLKLQVDSSYFSKTLAFVISEMGAAEIYLNGQKILQSGKVSAEFKNEQTRFY